MADLRYGGPESFVLPVKEGIADIRIWICRLRKGEKSFWNFSRYLSRSPRYDLSQVMPDLRLQFIDVMNLMSAANVSVHVSMPKIEDII